MHGPTSVLCSQVVPTSCSQCDIDPAAPDLSSSNDTSFSSSHSPSLSLDLPPEHGRDKPTSTSSNGGGGGGGGHEPAAHAPAELDPATASARCTTSTDLQQPPGSASASAPSTAQRIEDLPWFLGGSYGRAAADNTETLSGFRGAEGDTCSSCKLDIPEGVSKQLPPGAPGTLKEDGKVRNGSPVLRSREMVHSCSGSHAEHDDFHASHAHQSPSSSSPSPSPSQSPAPSSARSSDSYSLSDSACHPHVVTYLSLRGPPTPSDYALLRRASIRTLSCELLPRGLSSGPLSFGDSTTGYTIAYVFRLPDPMARGKRRSYALVALAGKDSGRAFRACPIIWRVFGRIASGLVSAAEKHQEREKHQEEGRRQRGNAAGGGGGSAANSTVQGRRITPVSSFLTGRTVDPDGRPRRAGQVRARNLTEIVGNEYMFAELHAQFVALLQQLRVPDPRSTAAATTATTARSEAFDEAGEGYFATHSSSSSTGESQSQSQSRPAERRSTSKNSNGSNNHTRIRSDVPPAPSSSVNPAASPKPIPISQRRQVAAT